MSKEKNGQVKKEVALVEQTAITDTLKTNYMPYAMSVIVSRAIPEIDGFKPSHRKILYTMYRMGLLKGSRSKCADIVGQTMSLNPHGDQAIYETLVRMTRGNGALINPWIDSKGNFGRVYSRDMQYAAYRYTEAKLDKSCETLFSGLNKNAVKFVDNYSGTFKEPVLLPAVFPTVLVNSNQGIAVGMASNICSFNLKEVCDATVALIDDPEVDLFQYMPAPDFSTGAEIVYDEDLMRKVYDSGRGSIQMRAICNINRKDKTIEITEIPYPTTIEAIMDDVIDNTKNGKLKEVTNVRDDTDLNGLKLTIDYRASADPKLLVQKLYQLTPMQSNFSCNFNFLLDGYPKVLGVREILKEWILWRRTCLRNEIQFDIDHKSDQLHILKGLELILLDIDKAIRIVRETEKDDQVLISLMKGFKIDEVQADAVAEIKLRQLNQEYILRRIKDIQNLESEINRLEKIVKSNKRLDKEIQKQLKDVAKKYGRERLTQLVDAEEVVIPDEEEFIEDYNLKVFFTADGYLKKMALTSLRSAGELKIKAKDRIIQEIEATNKSDVLFFTNKGQVHKMRLFELEDHKPSEFGEYTPNLLDMDKDEEVIAIHVTSEDYPGYLILGFADGRCIKLSVDNYYTKTNRRMLKNAFYDGAKLIGILYQEEENSAKDLVIQNTQDRMILVQSDRIKLKATRNSQGSMVMNLRNGYQVDYIGYAEQFPDNYDLDYYRARTLPAAGRFIKEEDMAAKQLSLIELEN
ncbi:MAG TPA: DNA gyrase subunit A [Candidatus Eisenbacteria bacterium]|nr:DNA gyrase subunit A [Candidatus Eisenbacteria bacterium]